MTAPPPFSADCAARPAESAPASAPSPAFSTPARAPRAPSPAARRTRAAALGSLLALALLALVWEMWPGGSWLALKCLPLLLPLGGLWRYRMYTYRWVSLFVWLYFTEGVVRASSDALAASRALALAQTLLCLALFAACTLHIRLRLKAARETAATAATESA